MSQSIRLYLYIISTKFPELPIVDRFFFNIIDSNVISCLIVLLVIFNLRISGRSGSYSSRAMLALCWTILAVLIVDALAWVFLDVPGKAGFYLIYLSNFLLFLLNPLPPSAWLFYIFVNFREGHVSKRERFLISLPVLINFIIMIYSLFSGFVFTVDPANQYHRGPGLLAVAAIDYSTIVAAVYLAIIHRNEMDKQIIRIVVIFSLFPLVGSMIQILFYGVSTSWPFMTVGILMTYIFIEVQQNIRDHLTGLLNRQKVEDIVIQRMTRSSPDKTFSLVVIDMNDFKAINDVYGHSEGDRALQVASLIISRSVQAGDVVARIGGDEFVIVLDTDSIAVIEGVMGRIHNGINRWNAEDREKFKLSLSMGYAVYNREKYKKYKDFFHDADEMMYRDKRDRKNASC